MEGHRLLVRRALTERPRNKTVRQNRPSPLAPRTINASKNVRSHNRTARNNARRRANNISKLFDPSILRPASAPAPTPPLPATITPLPFGTTAAAAGAGTSSPIVRNLINAITYKNIKTDRVFGLLDENPRLGDAINKFLSELRKSKAQGKQIDNNLIKYLLNLIYEEYSSKNESLNKFISDVEGIGML